MKPIEIIEHLCKRPTLWNPEIKSPEDLLAGIRGICMGIGDPGGERCLGDFPIFLQSRFPEYKNESWHLALAQFCTHKSLREACDALLNLMNEWQGSIPALPVDLFLHSHDRNDAIDMNTFQFMEDILRSPLTFVPWASTLRAILAFLWGIRVIRHPPHGNIPGLGEFSIYVKQHFHMNLVLRMDAVLLDKLHNYPFHNACLEIADLIKHWRDSMGDPTCLHG